MSGTSVVSRISAFCIRPRKTMVARDGVEPADASLFSLALISICHPWRVPDLAVDLDLTYPQSQPKIPAQDEHVFRDFVTPYAAT
jgi:hypothetical protein